MTERWRVVRHIPFDGSITVGTFETADEAFAAARAERERLDGNAKTRWHSVEVQPSHVFPQTETEWQVVMPNGYVNVDIGVEARAEGIHVGTGTIPWSEIDRARALAVEREAQKPPPQPRAEVYPKGSVVRVSGTGTRAIMLRKPSGDVIRIEMTERGDEMVGNIEMDEPGRYEWWPVEAVGQRSDFLVSAEPVGG